MAGPHRDGGGELMGQAGEVPDGAGRVSRAGLLVSRDCTVDDLEVIMPEASLEERERFLAGHRDRGDVVTFAVADVDGPLAGMIIGPPGSEGLLRRPGQTEPGGAVQA